MRMVPPPPAMKDPKDKTCDVVSMVCAPTGIIIDAVKQADNMAACLTEHWLLDVI
ncbi:MAG: hypothetical protein PSV24_09260 [Rhodoferax sp.]|nr:hypothetical protein [Rhodoferax sp.]